jgi:hypothetical protein
MHVVYLAVKWLAGLAFAVMVSALLPALGTVLGKVVLALAQWAGLLILSVLGGLGEVR